MFTSTHMSESEPPKRVRGRDDPSKRQLTAYIDAALHKRLKARAVDEEVGMQDIVERALKAHLDALDDAESAKKPKKPSSKQ